MWLYAPVQGCTPTLLVRKRELGCPSEPLENRKGDSLEDVFMDSRRSLVGRLGSAGHRGCPSHNGRLHEWTWRYDHMGRASRLLSRGGEARPRNSGEHLRLPPHGRLV